jgi:uncharacterized membrane protein YgdD (TMEM256/DUF423 family)
MNRRWGSVVGILGAVGVALGAIGSHVIKSRVTPERLETWKTGVFYHLAHVLALALALALAEKIDVKWCKRLWLAGILIFAGSLYLLVLLDLRIMGAIAPIGGSLLILGWLAFAFAWTKASPADSN